MMVTHDVKPVEVRLLESTDSTPEQAISQFDSHSFKSSINPEHQPRDTELIQTEQFVDNVDREDSDEDEGLSSDSNSIDDDALRSVDAFSSSDEDEDRGGVFYLGHENDDNRTYKVSTETMSYNKSSRLSQRTMQVRARHLESVLSKNKVSVMSSKRSKALSKMSRTDLKLITNGDQPTKGMLFFIAYTVLKSACFVVAKYLYNRNPKLDPFSMLMMRSIFALVCQAIMVNRKLKKAVWDGVDK